MIPLLSPGLALALFLPGQGYGAGDVELAREEPGPYCCNALFGYKRQNERRAAFVASAHPEQSSEPVHEHRNPQKVRSITGERVFSRQPEFPPD